MDLLMMFVVLAGIAAVVVLGGLAIGAAENVRIARHTGVDPRADREARKAMRETSRRTAP